MQVLSKQWQPNDVNNYAFIVNKNMQELIIVKINAVFYLFLIYICELAFASTYIKEPKAVNSKR